MDNSLLAVRNINHKYIVVGNYIHFDLTNMQDIDGILNGTSQYMNRTTSGELRHIHDNWDRLSGNIKFYSNGEEVLPPWMN